MGCFSLHVRGGSNHGWEGWVGKRTCWLVCCWAIADGWAREAPCQRFVNPTTRSILEHARQHQPHAGPNRASSIAVNPCKPTRALGETVAKTKQGRWHRTCIASDLQTHLQHTCHICMNRGLDFLFSNPMHCCTLSSKPFRLDAGRSNRVHTFDRVDCPLSASLHGDCLLPLLYLSGFRLPRPMQRYRCLGRRATVLPGGIGPDISGHCPRKQDSF